MASSSSARRTGKTPWREPSPARPECRSSRSRAPSSSRCSSASARRASATCSIRQSATRRASSSSTRSTRSVASVARDSADPRRARADPQPDPRRDGRVRHEHERHRRRRDEPSRRPRPGAPAPGPIRPSGHPRPAGHQGSPRDPQRPLQAASRWTRTSSSKASPARSPGFSGADLANLVNEAAILAARRNKKMIGLTKFQEALKRIVPAPSVIHGSSRTTRKRSSPTTRAATRSSS